MYELERSGQDGSSSPSSSPSSVHSFTTQTAKQSVHSHASTMSLVHAETRKVGRIKALVLLVIAVAAATCGVMTYVFVKISEYREFKVQFGDYATEIADLSHQEAYSMINAVKGLSSTVTSMALAMGATFPNVTVPHFTVHGKMNNAVSKATQVTFVPLVAKQDRLAWEEYAQEKQASIRENFNETETSAERFTVPKRIHTNAKHVNGDALVLLDPTDEGIGDDAASWYAPIWQQAPESYDASIVNFNLLAHPTFARLLHGVRETKQAALSEAIELGFLYGSAAKDKVLHPHSILMQPIYPSLKEHNEKDVVVAVLIAVVSWSNFLSSILHEGSNGIVVVLHDSCGGHFSYRLDGPTATYLGGGDLHNHKYDKLVQETPFAPLLDHDVQEGAHDEDCHYNLRMYPSEDLEQRYTTNRPFWFALIVVLIFSCTALVFLLFDYAVAIRQQRIMAKAKRTQAIVSSLFPSQVRDRMMAQADAQEERDENQGKSVHSLATSKARLYDFLGRGSSICDEDLRKTKPIADLYPSATVMFADIVGFTAWSSTRAPSQVFTLLETLYHAFDEIARRRRVFKVETIGDCYVAVAGLPEPRRDHALVMCRFARDCLEKVSTLTTELETTLGPDTGELSMRVGLHSGPVTAGVLRGDKARFQLFGDTVNTAARMESTGERNRIHCSHETATLIADAGKNWTHKREDLVVAKGKGKLQTYWIRILAKGAHSDPSQSVTSGDAHSTGSAHEGWPEHMPNGREKQHSKPLPVDKTQRLVDWNTDVVCRFLKQVVVHKQVRGVDETHTDDVDLKRNDLILAEAEETTLEDSKVVLDPVVVAQVRSYIATIASLHQDHAFHNFEHASRVMMSVTKLLSCLTGVVLSNNVTSNNQMPGNVTLDPLLHLACVFVALIHDVDHPGGVPGEPLMQQHSERVVNLAWDALMQPEYVELQQVLGYGDDDKSDDWNRFRALVVSAVKAANSFDILWSDTLSSSVTKIADGGPIEGTEQVAVDSVVPRPVDQGLPTHVLVEQVMQTAVVSHTMQHWQIYRKWNERRFRESMTAFQQGHCDINPADAFYNQELDFLDNGVIPLAQKLKAGRVFGAASDELVAYALQNRHEWQARGRDEVLHMAEKYRGATSVSIMAATATSVATATAVADAARDRAVQLQQVSENGSAPEDSEPPVSTEQAGDEFLAKEPFTGSAVSTASASAKSLPSDEPDASFNGHPNDATLISI